MFRVTRRLASYLEVDRIKFFRSIETVDGLLKHFGQEDILEIGTLTSFFRELVIKSGKAQVDIRQLPEFLTVVQRLTAGLQDLDGKGLSSLAHGATMLRQSSPEITVMVSKIGDVVCRRENGFSPRSLASLALSLSSCQVRDARLIDFIRLECSKLLHDFDPTDLVAVLESQWRFGVFNRQFIDMITERITDEIDRLTTKDIVHILDVMGKMSLARGYLIRRLSVLSFENIHQFSTRQVFTLLFSLSRLRFLKDNQMEDIVDQIMPHLGTTPKAALAEGLLSLAAMDYSSDRTAEVVDEFAKCFWSDNDMTSSRALISMVWALTYYEQSVETDIIKKVLSLPIPKNRDLLLQVNDICGYYDTKLPSNWKTVIDELILVEGERVELSRLHNEILMFLQNISKTAVRDTRLPDNVREKLSSNFEGNKPCEMYRVDFFDKTKNLVLEVETLNRTASHVLKHRYLQKKGYQTIMIPYWSWRRLKGEESQSEYLKDLLLN